MKVVWGIVVGFLVTVITTTVCDLVSEELRSRLDRVPYVVIHVAIRRLPDDVRQSVGNEWLAELHHIVRHAKGRPITRLLSATRYALGLLYKARRIGRELKAVRTGAVPASQNVVNGLWTFRRIAIMGVTSVAAVGIGSAVIEAIIGSWLVTAPSITTDSSSFIRETFPDGSPVRINEQFTKTWELRNTGSVVWRDRYLTRQAPGGALDLCSSPSRVPIPTTLPGQDIEISVPVTAPSLPGSCRVDWKMTDANGKPFFPGITSLFFLVNVTQ
jgi:hypothetical protein